MKIIDKNMEIIYFIVKGHNLYHDVQSIIQVFYPNLHYFKTDTINSDTITVESIIEDGFCKAVVYDKGKKLLDNAVKIDFEPDCDKKRETKRFIKTSIYNLLSKITGIDFPWGILTGIRPAKNVNELWKSGKTDKQVTDIFSKKYLVSDRKIDLAIKVAKAETNILKSNSPEKVSLYIGIPFCATRCLYCSFTSYSLLKYSDMVDLYIEALTKELEYIAQYSKGYTVENIYIGGGTPTALNEKQLETLLKTICNLFETFSLKEFTVEAGRPDTITYEKLRIMKQYKITRISINPQTMNQKTLDIIGRKHTINDVETIFSTARTIGYDNINMDIIVGLPYETVEDVENTLKRIEMLSPDSMTVHTLSVKRASVLKENLDVYKFTNMLQIEKMLNISSEYADKMKMIPYYMYRQKNMLGNLENVGYAKQNKQCIYNVQIMEETQTILAAGAGSTTKIVYSDNRIERIFNVKNLTDYIYRIDEMIERKNVGLPSKIY